VLEFEGVPTQVQLSGSLADVWRLKSTELERNSFHVVLNLLCLLRITFPSKVRVNHFVELVST
jgi:hypothetical protein